MNVPPLPIKNPGAVRAAGAGVKSACRHCLSDTLKKQVENRQELDTAKARVGIATRAKAGAP